MHISPSLRRAQFSLIGHISGFLFHLSLNISLLLFDSVWFGWCAFFSVLHFLILEAMSARTTKSLVIIIVHRYKTKSKMCTKCERKGDREREKDRTRYGQNDDYIHTYVYMYRLWWTHTIIIIQYKRSY